MATLTLRSVKGSPLTNAEVDGNFTALNTELATKLTATDYNAADILAKLKTVDGAGSGLDADTLDGHTYSHYTPGAFVISSVSRTSSTTTVTTSSAHGFAVSNSVKVFGVSDTSFNGTYTIVAVPSATTFTYTQAGLANVTSTAQTRGQCYVAVTGESIPDRDASGSLTTPEVVALNVYANLIGNVTGNVTGTLTGNATNVSGTVAIANGGTGATDAAAARTALGIGSLGTQASNAVNITGGSISTLTTDLAIADGGTGASDAAGARTNLGLVIGTNVQAYDGDLTAIAALSTAGLIVRTGTNTAAARTLTGTAGYITVTNGDGAAGDPTITVGSNVAKLDADASWSTTGSIKLPVGNTTQRGTAAAGRIRFNSELNQFEGNNGTAWGAIGAGATGGVGNYVFFENDINITANYTITAGKNAMTAGPVTINDGVTVTVPDGSVWTIV